MKAAGTTKMTDFEYEQLIKYYKTQKKKLRKEKGDMSYILRDYQQQASDSAVTFFNNKTKKTNAIMVLPTGSGKSLIIADIASRLDGHTLVFQPSKEILEQNFKKLCSYGILDCSIYSASFNSKEISRITFATIGSVKSHPELLPTSRISSWTSVTL